MKKFRVISIYIYRSDIGDCTNGGISSRTDHIYIPCETGPTWSDQVDPELLFLTEQRGPEYWAAYPMQKNKAGLLGPMSGGNLATCSDSRVNHIYHVHDRYETQELYNALSI